MKHKINVVTRLQDNGDGGWTVFVYNSEKELLKDHPRASEYKEVNGKYKEVKVELTQEQKDNIINEENPHNDGYIGSAEININIKDGKATLAESFSIHAGQ